MKIVGEPGCVAIPVALLLDLEIPDGAKVTYGLLRARAFGEISSGMDSRTVRRHLLQLEERGWILRTPGQIEIRPFLSGGNKPGHSCPFPLFGHNLLEKEELAPGGGNGTPDALSDAEKSTEKSTSRKANRGRRIVIPRQDPECYLAARAAWQRAGGRTESSKLAATSWDKGAEAYGAADLSLRLSVLRDLTDTGFLPALHRALRVDRLEDAALEALRVRAGKTSRPVSKPGEVRESPEQIAQRERREAARRGEL